MTDRDGNEPAPRWAVRVVAVLVIVAVAAAVWMVLAVAPHVTGTGPAP